MIMDSQHSATKAELEVITFKEEIESWRESVFNLSNLIKETSANDQVCDILEAIYAEQFYPKEAADYFETIQNTASQAISINFNEKTIHFTDIISEIMVIPLEELCCLEFAKINFKIFKQNAEIVAKENTEKFVHGICFSVFNALSNITQTATRKFVHLQLQILAEIQKFLPEEKFRGNNYIVQLILNLPNNSGIEEKIKNILNNQLNVPSFYEEIFSVEECVEFYLYILEIFPKIFADYSLISAAMIFCELLIKSIAQNLPLLEKNPDLYSNLIDDTVNLIILSHEQSASNVRSIERYLVSGLCGTHLSLNTICFDVLCKFLCRQQDASTIASHFNFFQDLLIHSRNGSRIDTDDLDIAQSLIVNILKLLLKMHPDHLKPNIKAEVATYFDVNAKQHADFPSVFKSFCNLPSSHGYYSLVNSVRSLNPTEDEETLKCFTELLEIVAKCDWETFSSLVNSTLDAIKSTAEYDKKVIFLLKLQSALACKQIPTSVGITLTQVLASSTSEISEHSSQSTSEYFNDLLKKLTNQNFVLKQAFHNVTSDKIVSFQTDDEIGELLDLASTYEFNCSQIMNADKHQQSENLQMILEYSEWLTSKKERLSEKEINLMLSINLNFENITKEHEFSEINSYKMDVDEIYGLLSDTNQQFDNLRMILEYSEWLTSEKEHLSEKEINVILSIILNFENITKEHELDENVF